MKRLRLKRWVIPSFAALLLTSILITYNFVSEFMNHNFEPEQDYVTDTIVTKSQPVNKEIEKEPKQNESPKKIFVKPVADDISITKYYYNKDSDEERQQKSLIKYSNIYMPNTGLLYSNDEEFDIYATKAGKITNIKDDEILGKIIEIEHDNNIVTIYQSIKDPTVKVGQKVNAGDVIAKSGSNKLENEKDNCLHFEVYKEGSLINPEEFFQMETK